MTTIGDPNTARMLYQHFDGDMESQKRAPKGFRKVGAGCYRLAVLEKATNTVYKIGDGDINIIESYNSRRLRKKSTRSLGFDLIIPRTRTYRMPNQTKPNRPWVSDAECVGVQEFVIGGKFTYCASQDDWRAKTPKCNCSSRSSICFGKVHDIVRDWSSVGDIHSGNILVDQDNKFWLIDMGA